MNRLKELRKEKKLTQGELAKKIGVHYRTLQNWENNKAEIKSDKAQLLADELGVSVGYLLGYSDNVESDYSDWVLDTVDKVNWFEKHITNEDSDKYRKRKFRNFVIFLKKNNIILNDDEIKNFFNLLLVSDLSSGLKNSLYSKIIDEDFLKAVEFLENNGYKIFFDKSYNDKPKD